MNLAWLQYFKNFQISQGAKHKDDACVKTLLTLACSKGILEGWPPKRSIFLGAQVVAL